MTTTLGTIGNRIDLSHVYAAGSFQQDVTFQAEGLTFRAQRFVRTDTATKIDAVDLYIMREGEWIHDYVGRIGGELYLDGQRRMNPSRVTARALHLLAVADAAIPSDTAERFALLEMV